MKKFIKFVLVLIFPIFVSAQPYVCKITTFWDGDNGRLLIQVDSATVSREDFRLIAMDCPEKPNPFNGLRGQPYGLEAGAIMRDTFLGKVGVFYPMYVDNFGRTVGRVVVEGVDLSHWAIQNGLAWYVPNKNLSETENLTLKLEKKAAMKSRKGLWGEPGRKIAPWTWRARNRV